MAAPRRPARFLPWPAVRATLLALVAMLLLAPPARASTDAPQPPASTLAADAAKRIDDAVAEVLAKNRVPGASIAVVRDARVVYARAYGHARLEPQPVAAEPALRYAIGSISKQFAATALLLLEQDGRLSLDDRVEKHLPGLTRGGEVTIRQLLAHTSGYQDYWPQDYTFGAMLQATTPEHLLAEWARRPLDYEPGTRWQYSNTGYVAAARIVERVSGEPYFRFLERRIFTPLGLASASNFDREPLAPGTVTGYHAYALGPPRPSTPSGPGWLFGAGDLAMSATDLAKWDIALIERGVLPGASRRALETEGLLANGVSTGYGLGLSIDMDGQRRRLQHGGEVSGFTALNTVYPDERTAIVVLTNLMATRAPEQLTERIGRILFEHGDATDAARALQARGILEGLQRGQLDRGLFSSNANEYFSTEALADFQSSLAPLGTLERFEHRRTWLRGGMTGRSYEATFGGSRKLRVWTYELADGRLEQFQVAATD